MQVLFNGKSLARRLDPFPRHVTSQLSESKKSYKKLDYRALLIIDFMQSPCATYFIEDKMAVLNKLSIASAVAEMRSQLFGVKVPANLHDTMCLAVVVHDFPSFWDAIKGKQDISRKSVAFFGPLDQGFSGKLAECLNAVRSILWDGPQGSVDFILMHPASEVKLPAKGLKANLGIIEWESVDRKNLASELDKKRALDYPPSYFARKFHTASDLHVKMKAATPLPPDIDSAAREANGAAPLNSAGDPSGQNQGNDAAPPDAENSDAKKPKKGKAKPTKVKAEIAQQPQDEAIQEPLDIKFDSMMGDRPYLAIVLHDNPDGYHSGDSKVIISSSLPRDIRMLEVALKAAGSRAHGRTHLDVLVLEPGKETVGKRRQIRAAGIQGMNVAAVAAECKIVAPAQVPQDPSASPDKTLQSLVSPPIG